MKKEKEKIIVPKLNKSSTKKSNDQISSKNINARVQLLGMQIEKTRKGNTRTKKEKGKGKTKYFLVDTFDASNPIDILKGEYGSDKMENMTEEKLLQIVTKQASLVSFPEKETPEVAYDEKEIRQKFEQKGIQVSDDFRDGYDYNTKLRFHDAGRHNGMIVAILDKYAIFAIGTDYPKVVLDVNRSFPTHDQEKEELLKLTYNFIYYRIKNEIERLDRKVNLRHAMYSTIINAKQYGRHCHLIQDDPDTGMPVSIKPLNSMRLGRVFTSQLDWNSVEGIQYLDFRKNENVIFKENMIYAINRNFHQSPNSYNYGYSDIEPVKYLVELNTIIDSMDMKQINKRRWAPLLIVKVSNTDDPLAISRLRDAYKRFTSIFTTVDHTTENIATDHGGEFLLNERKANDIKIADDMGMPIILLGKELPNTRATASQILQSFNNTSAKSLRIWIREIYEKQWYGRNVIKIIKKINEERQEQIKDPIIEEEREIFNKFIEDEKEKKKNEIKSLVRKSNLYQSLRRFHNPIPEQQEQEQQQQQPQAQPPQFRDQNQNQNNNPSQKEQQQQQEQEQQERNNQNPINQQQQQQQDQKQQIPDLNLSVERIDQIIDQKVEEEFKKYIEDEDKILDRLIQYNDYFDLPFKVKVTFGKITFDTALETSAYVSGLLKDEIIDLETAQQELDHEEMTEKTKTENKAEEILEEILLEMKIDNPTPNPIPNMQNKVNARENEDNENENEDNENEDDDNNKQMNERTKRGFQNQNFQNIRNRRSAVRTDTTGTT